MARWLVVVALAGLLSTSEVVRDKAQVEHTRRAEQRWFFALKDGMQAMCNLQRGWGFWNAEGAKGYGSCENEPPDSWHAGDAGVSGHHAASTRRFIIGGTFVP